MANITLIIGESGTGKSSSIETLDPKETFVINVIDKPLPFRGANTRYKRRDKDNAGNYTSTDDYDKILKVIAFINKEMPHVKNVIIDDFQYIMANEFMRRAKERGYEKFTEIAQHAWTIISNAQLCRDDLYFFFLSHSESTQDGIVKAKTIGKMLDDKITVEGMFTVVFHSLINDGKYKFLTQNDSVHIAKSPRGMFDDKAIDNDLGKIKVEMSKYYGENEVFL